MEHKKQVGQSHQWKYSLALFGASLIWGFAFVSQSVGARYVGANTFLAGRSWIAVIVLIPGLRVADLIRKKTGLPSSRPANRTQRRLHMLGGAACGTALFLASAAQQIGISDTTTAKAGFITALYVVIVPLFSIFVGRAPGKRIWVSVMLGVIGLYFLCMADGFGEIRRGDLLMMLCALVFSVQILLVMHFSSMIDGIRLSFAEVLTEAILASVSMLIFEHPTLEALKAAAPALLYAGVMSSGIAYTLQIIGQKGLDPTIASLIMCLESVFSAIGGWLFLGQRLTARELFGCALMFAAIVLSQIQDGKGKGNR